MKIIYSEPMCCKHPETFLGRDVKSNCTSEFWEVCVRCFRRMRQVYKKELLELGVDLRRVLILSSQVSFTKGDTIKTLNRLSSLPEGYELTDTGQVVECYECWEKCRLFFCSFNWLPMEMDSDDPHHEHCMGKVAAMQAGKGLKCTQTP